MNNNIPGPAPEFDVPSFTDVPTTELMRTLWSTAISRQANPAHAGLHRSSIGQRVASPTRDLPAQFTETRQVSGRTETLYSARLPGGPARGGHIRPARVSDGRIHLELRSSANVSLLRTRLLHESRVDATAEQIRRRCAQQGAYEIRQTEQGQWWFELLDATGASLASSRRFDSEALARATIKLAQLHGPGANREPIPETGQILVA